MVALPIRRHKGLLKPRGHWRDIERRRKVFCDFARENGFDPFNPDGWKEVTVVQFASKKVLEVSSLVGIQC
jgi:hypothetical protein